MYKLTVQVDFTLVLFYFPHDIPHIYANNLIDHDEVL